MSITFRDDYRFALLGTDKTIKAGDRLVVPMFWAYWLVKRQETVQNWAYVRLVADVAAVVTAGITLNPGPVLVLDAAVAAVDIGFTIAEDRIASSGDSSAKEISELWDTFYATYGLTRLVTGAVGSVRRFQFNGETLTANINQLRNSPQELEKLADYFYKLVNSAQKFQPVGNTRNLAYSMLLSAWLRIKIATFSRTAEGTELLVQGAYSVVAKSGSHASAIMTVEVIGKELIFTNIRWCPEAGEVSQTGRFLMIGKYSYRDRAGRVVEGDLEIVKLTNGQSYVREVGKAGSFSDETLEAWSKFDDNVLDVADAGKQNWKTFQNRTNEQLKNRYPGKKIGNQITLDVTFAKDGQTFTPKVATDFFCKKLNKSYLT